MQRRCYRLVANAKIGKAFHNRRRAFEREIQTPGTVAASKHMASAAYVFKPLLNVDVQPMRFTVNRNEEPGSKCRGT